MKTKLKMISPLLCGLVLCSCYAAGNKNEALPGDMRENKPYFSYADGTEKFSSYSFILKGEKENFLTTVAVQENGSALLTLEGSDYSRRNFEVSPPEGYKVIFPDKATNASQAVNIIRNDFDRTDVPDLIEVMFRRISDDDDIPPTAGRYFAADDEGNLREIAIYDKTGTTGTVKLDYLDRIRLNHTSANKFIYEIIVGDIYGEDGNFLPAHERVKIKSMAFDPIQYRFIIDYEQITTGNPLYFGYAYLAAANTAAQYMTVELMPGISDTDYIELTDESGAESYYFSVDSRLRNVRDLKKYLDSVFTGSLSESLMENAPQDYRDHLGRLYSRDECLDYDVTLGILTFTDMEITENSMLFRSRQEQYDENGNMTGYTDGGNFIISTLGMENWKVVQYRFPYLR